MKGWPLLVWVLIAPVSVIAAVDRSSVKNNRTTPVLSTEPMSNTSNVFFVPGDPLASMPKQLEDLKRLRNRDKYVQREKPNSLRLKFVKLAARTAGSQRGLYWRSVLLQRQFRSAGRLLDGVYSKSFTALMIRHRDFYIVPPVITGSRGGMRKSDDGRVLRVAERTFRILRDPYFVTRPPTWRDYLLFPPPTPRKVDAGLLPANELEESIWAENVVTGWNAGIRQADHVMRTHLARMTRDLVGMVRYHSLLIRKMVTAPDVDERYMPVSGGGREMSLQDSIIRITSDPSLNADRDRWRALPNLPSTESLFPFAYRLGIRDE